MAEFNPTVINPHAKVASDISQLIGEDFCWVRLGLGQMALLVTPLITTCLPEMQWLPNKTALLYRDDSQVHLLYERGSAQESLHL